MALLNEQFSSEDSDTALSKRRKITRISPDDIATDSSSDIIPFHHLPVRRNINLSSSEDEEDDSDYFDNNANASSANWCNPSGNQPQLAPFSGTHGFKILDRNCEKVEDIYSLLLDDRVLDIVVDQTNRYAEKTIEKTSPHLDKWKPTHKTEIKQFLGLLMWMGIVKLPEIHLYWSKDTAYAQTLPSSVLSRNRFEILLRMLNFSDNEKDNLNDCLYKIKDVIDLVNENFQKCCDPSEILYADEYLIPFRGRVTFRHNRHDYRIKMFKLFSAPGYTVNFQIYCEKKTGKDRTTPANVVSSLCKNILDKGHTLCTDDRYTSIDLARQLIARNTHLVGTMRPNRRGIPRDVVAKKLKRYEHVAKESADGLTLLKWKHKRDVLLLSTKHSDEAVVSRINGYDCTKPKIVLDYNEGRSYADVSDQMSFYCYPLRKSAKWYKKILLELFLNTAVVNAWIIYNTFTSNKLTGVEFRKQLSMRMMFCQGDNSLSAEPEKVRHEIKKKDGKFDLVRKRCKGCYESNVKKFGSKLARNCTIKVVTFCDGCPEKSHFCLPCFNKVHSNMSV